MTYEIDCAGLSLAIRVSGPSMDPPTPWCIEVMSDGTDAVIASASADSRAHAFELVAERFRDSTASTIAERLDWEAIADAVTAARAL